MKNTIQKYLTLILMTVVYSHSGAQTMTDLVYQELESVNGKNKTLVVAGKQYKYQLKVENSSYIFSEDAKTAVPFSQLRVGESYYFELMAEGNDVKSQNFNKVIFISKSKPSE